MELSKEVVGILELVMLGSTKAKELRQVESETSEICDAPASFAVAPLHPFLIPGCLDSGISYHSDSREHLLVYAFYSLCKLSQNKYRLTLFVLIY